MDSEKSGGGVHNIVGVSGDAILQEYTESAHLNFYSLEEIDSCIQQNTLHIDWVLSFLYSKIIKNKLINSAKYGCINFHPAPLPDYKGRGGCSFAVLDHLTEWGCTAHFIDEGIDSGSIISVKRFPINWETETGYSLKKKTVIVLKELYKEILKEISQNKTLKSFPQDLKLGKYVSKKDMLAAMKIQEYDDIDAKIQAFWFPPHEGAYITLNGQKYTLVNGVVLKQIQDMMKKDH